ncbi:MAG: sulfotransferase [Pseudomonadota bacterium]
MARCTVILSTQRSGTTFLEGCLSSTEMLGYFKEHFTRFVRLPGLDTRYDTSPHGFLQCLRNARDASGNAGFTLMASYLPAVAADYYAEPARTEAESQHAISVRFLRDLFDGFDDAGIIVLRRNAMQQGISAYFSVRTGYLHNYVEGRIERREGKTHNTHEEVLEVLDPADVVRIAKTRLVENDFVDAVGEAVGVPMVRTTYDRVTSDPGSLPMLLAELGVENAADAKITVRNEKVVPNQMAEQAAEKVADYLQVPDWDWDSLEESAASFVLPQEDEMVVTPREQALEAELNRVFRYPWKYATRFVRRS